MEKRHYIRGSRDRSADIIPALIRMVPEGKYISTNNIHAHALCNPSCLFTVRETSDDVWSIVSVCEGDFAAELMLSGSDWEELVPEHDNPMPEADILLHAESEETEADWYGDYSYRANPLERFMYCEKHCLCRTEYGKGCIKEMSVWTTVSFLEYMGWESFKEYSIKFREP